MRISGVVVVAAIVALIAIGAGLVTIITYLGGIGTGVSPFITTLLGLIGTVVVSLLALVRIEQTRHDIQNGVVKNQVKDAMEERAEEYASTGKDDRK